jgi:hypothetical protein
MVLRITGSSNWFEWIQITNMAILVLALVGPKRSTSTLTRNCTFLEAVSPGVSKLCYLFLNAIFPNTADLQIDFLPLSAESPIFFTPHPPSRSEQKSAPSNFRIFMSSLPWGPTVNLNTWQVRVLYTISVTPFYIYFGVETCLT